jgi:hypothetical protein
MLNIDQFPENNSLNRTHVTYSEFYIFLKKLWHIIYELTKFQALFQPETEFREVTDREAVQTYCTNLFCP